MSLARNFKTVGMRVLARMIQAGENVSVTVVDRDLIIVGQLVVEPHEWELLDGQPYGRGFSTLSPVTFKFLRDGHSPIGYRIHTPLGGLDVSPTVQLSVPQFFRGQECSLSPFMLTEREPRGPLKARNAA